MTSDPTRIPRKHAELIHAWADGATIECWYQTEQMWVVVDTPVWIPEYHYRIQENT